MMIDLIATHGRATCSFTENTPACANGKRYVWAGRRPSSERTSGARPAANVQEALSPPDRCDSPGPGRRARRPASLDYDPVSTMGNPSSH
jgi:hypothetical protein